VPALEAAGYVLHLREPGWYEHRLLKGPDTAPFWDHDSVGLRDPDA
jgi:hypothetical protein